MSSPLDSDIDFIHKLQELFICSRFYWKNQQDEDEKKCLLRRLDEAIALYEILWATTEHQDSLGKWGYRK